MEMENLSGGSKRQTNRRQQLHFPITKIENRQHKKFTKIMYPV